MLSVFPDVEDVATLCRKYSGEWVHFCPELVFVTLWNKRLATSKHNQLGRPKTHRVISLKHFLSYWSIFYFSFLDAWGIYDIVIHVLKTSEKVQDLHIFPYLLPSSLPSPSKYLLGCQLHLSFLFSPTLWAPCHHQFTWPKTNRLVHAAAETSSDKFNWEYTGLFLLKYWVLYTFKELRVPSYLYSKNGIQDHKVHIV